MLQITRRYLGLAAIFVLMALVLVWAGMGSASGEPVRIVFISTQNDADCILLSQGPHNILIDTGEEGDAEHITGVLRELGVETIEYLILTHPDKDHIGGAPEIMRNFQVKAVTYPNYQRDTNLQNLVNTVIEEQNIRPIIPTKSRRFRCGDLRLVVFPPNKGSYGNDNNYSLITLVTHGDVDMLFTGDAQNARLTEAMDYGLPAIDLYKVSHHGRAGSAGEELIGMITPRNAVVTASEVDPGIKAALERAGARIYFSAGKDAADLFFLSDGSAVEFVAPGERDGSAQ